MKKFLLVFAMLLVIAGCEKEDSVTMLDEQNHAPEVFDLLMPSEGAQLDVYDISFQWQRPSTAENSKLTYDLYVYREGSTPVRVAEKLADPSYVLDGRSLFNHTYNWYVVAKDEQHRETMSPVRAFTTRDLQPLQIHNGTSGDMFSERYAYTGVYFNNSFFIMNGYGDHILGDVWSSKNYGQNWSLETDMTNTGFERYAHTHAIFNNKLYIMGGYRDGQPLSDMYSTMNGRDWIKEVPSARFTPRYEHTTLVFKDKMWVIGGYNNDMLMDDVMSWTGDTKDPWMMEASGLQTPFDGIRGHSAVVYDDKMWIIGGSDRNGYLNKVWTSRDGKNWMPVMEMPMRIAYHKSVVFDNKIWVIGGLSESGPSNEVYYYDMHTNNWVRYEMPMDFRAMYNHAVITVNEGTSNDGIYILGSYDGNNYIRDMWKLY